MAFRLEISEDEFEELTRSRLRLFLSVDVVGSTAFKHHSTKADAQGWLDFFTSFYTEFPNFLSTAHAQALASCGLPVGGVEPARLWKVLGDELVFVVGLARRDEAVMHLHSFRSAIGRAVTHYVHGQARLPIHFKASAWLAGFPVGNAAIPTDGKASPVAFDFVGPSIDLGFRLGRLATPRRFVVSVELAYLILSCRDVPFRFQYEGKEPLRGVLNGRDYPVIWIDSYQGIEEDDRHREHRLTDFEDDLLRREPAAHGTLKDFCGACIDEIGRPLMPPFIESDPDGGLPKPPGYDGDLERIETRLRDLFTITEKDAGSSIDESEIAERESEIEEGLKDLPE